jgi:hypothetical protein
MFLKLNRNTHHDCLVNQSLFSGQYCKSTHRSFVIMREVLLAFGTDIIGIAYQLSIGPEN